jgi:hypothetical protein
MKNGDQIKAFVKVGLMREERWIKGTIISCNCDIGLQELKDLGFYPRVKQQDEYLVEVAGNRLILTPDKIRLWEPLKFVQKENNDYFCDKIENFISKQWGDLKQKCLAAVGKFFPEVKLKINEEEKTISVEDQYGPYLTVSCGVTEKKSIARFFEAAAWEVVLWVPTPGTRWEPPDVEEKNCGFSETTIGAARLLVDNIWSVQSEEYWQVIQDAELADCFEGEQW